MSINPIDRINGLQGPDTISPVHIPAGEKNVTSFKETFETFLNEVNDAQKAASDIQKKFLAGEITDVHQVRIKSEESNTAFNMLMELRNKGLDGFSEIMRVKL